MKVYFSIILLFVLFSRSMSLVAQDKPEPRFVEIYFENRDGEKVTKVKISDEYVYMVIVSENAIGEKFNLLMEEDDGDYIYKKRFLSAGEKIQGKIKGNVHKIKLTIFNPGKKKHQKIKQRQEKKKAPETSSAIPE